MTSRRLPVAATFTAALCLLAGCAGPSTTPPSGSTAGAASSAADPECPDVTRLRSAQLYGTWELELIATGQRGQLTLSQHPEFSESLRGEFRYGTQRSIASGDVEAGEFNLDESLDGKSLYAFWSGQLTPAKCGAEIRGTWQTLPRDGKPSVESPFVLRREGW